jgi:hypothetical protein
MLRELRDNPSASFIDVVAMPAVYHGTPHEVEQFSTEKIGTGEGYQAFGWGIYFSDAKEVADFYRKKLADQKNNPPVRWFKDQKLVPGSPEYHAATLLSGGQSLAKVRKEVQGWITDAEGDPNYAKEMEGWKKTLALLNQAQSPKDFKEEAPEGNLYTANIPDVSQLLDWDKTVADQPAGVRSKLVKTEAYAEANKRAKDGKFKNGDQLTGGEFYGGLQNYKKMSAKDASLYLMSLGIPGLCYFDSDSRGNGTGTRNYVIWDDASITDEKLHAGSKNIKFWIDPAGTFHGFGGAGDYMDNIAHLDWLAQNKVPYTETDDSAFGELPAKGWVRGYLQDGSLTLTLDPAATSVAKALGCIPQEYRFVDDVFVEGVIDPDGNAIDIGAVPVLDGEDALDAWTHRKDARHRMVTGMLVAHIEKRGDEWVVTNKARTKTLGTHKDRKSAQKQLAAIEIAKHMHGGLLAENQFDRLYKVANTVAQDDAKYSAALESPALAQEQGQFQQQVKDARSEDDLQRVWNTFQPSVTWEALTSMAGGYAHE